MSVCLFGGRWVLFVVGWLVGLLFVFSWSLNYVILQLEVDNITCHCQKVNIPFGSEERSVLLASGGFLNGEQTGSQQQAREKPIQDSSQPSGWSWMVAGRASSWFSFVLSLAATCGGYIAGPGRQRAEPAGGSISCQSTHLSSLGAKSSLQMEPEPVTSPHKDIRNTHSTIWGS